MNFMDGTFIWKSVVFKDFYNAKGFVGQMNLFVSRWQTKNFGNWNLWADNNEICALVGRMNVETFFWFQTMWKNVSFIPSVVLEPCWKPSHSHNAKLTFKPWKIASSHPLYFFPNWFQYFTKIVYYMEHSSMHLSTQSSIIHLC